MDNFLFGAGCALLGWAACNGFYEAYGNPKKEKPKVKLTLTIETDDREQFVRFFEYVPSNIVKLLKNDAVMAIEGDNGCNYGDVPWSIQIEK